MASSATWGAKDAPQSEDWQPILPVPPNSAHPSDRLLQCDMLHEYFDPEDRLLLYVRPHERKNDKGKQFHPLTYGRLNGRLGWHAKAPPAPRPLYRLNALSHAIAVLTLVSGLLYANIGGAAFLIMAALCLLAGPACAGLRAFPEASGA
jgi:hypothetical protein